MKLEENIIKADFENNWLICTSDEQLKIVPKDKIIVRWLKFLIQVLSCCYCDVYGHVRINRVSLGIWENFKNEPDHSQISKDKYITLIKNLLDSNLENRRPITTFRKDLLELHKKISTFKNPS